MNELIGNSRWAEDVRRSIGQVAGCGSSVLIVGPSGTGKELIAQAIHRHSPRSAAPFVAVDCTSIPPSLFPSQLFGHVKGAFSGAGCSTLGSFRAADGGTIFLDEIGELYPELQAQLLRVIQQRAVIPVGSHHSIPIDVRIIAATSRHLAGEVDAGRFRLDLYYRLNVVKIETTPLRDRPEDIEPLCRHFLDRLSRENGLPQKRLSASAIRVLSDCDWPGNVRQLQNVLERAVVFTQPEEITDQHILRLLEPEIAAPVAERRPLLRSGARAAGSPRSTAPDSGGRGQPAGVWHGGDDLGSWPTLAESERRLIEETLERTFYNQSAAARLLDIDRRLLARKVRKYGIVVPSHRPRHRARSA
jgi:two-component system response regulator HydG